MNDHERSIRLAALELSEILTAADARSLESHLNDCMNCRREHAALTRDHGRLRALVAPRPTAESSRELVLGAVGRPQGRLIAQLLLAAALTLLLVATMAIWAGSRRAPALPSGFAGSYSATNCATHSLSDDQLTFDCERWGDGATIALEIGSGNPASIQLFTDTGHSCSGSGTLNTTPPQPAEGTFLWIETSDPSCDFIDLGDDLASHLYLEPNGRRIWFDDDGDNWGLFWIRSE
jgi:hypothetical protein